MTDKLDKLVPESPSTIPTPETNHVAPSAAQVLQEFLDNKGIEIKLTAPQFRFIEGGLLKLDPAQIVADYKKEQSTIPGSQKN